MAGPNGSGKTTWVHEALRRHPSFRYLGADAIAERLSPGAPEKAQIAAGRTFLRQFETALREGDSLFVESTLSGHTMTRFLKLAREQGYWIGIVYLFVSGTQLCIERVEHRVHHGGHDVPVPDIVRRYARSLRRFWKTYRWLADEWHLRYNAGKWFELTATGESGTIDIVNEELYDVFQAELTEHV